ncbi:BON domain-containing protein [Candidatus Fermentibacteria bacterium]|nr:BON domain-containing protein [Candidatus Fermentibacteria bacterium]
MERSDEQIKKDVIDNLYWDSRIDASKVMVEVSNGRVNVTGKVPTYGHVQKIRSTASRIDGVTEITDSFDVSYATPPELPTNEDIRERAESILAWTPAIDEADITVSSVDGVVTLTGTVDEFWKKAVAQEKIYELHGVIRLDNRLSVAPLKKTEDEVIAREVASALERDPMVDSLEVAVEVSAGAVTLRGSVPSLPSRRSAEKDASITAGVTAVINELEVAS